VTDVAPSTTWALVSRYPSLRNITAEPLPVRPRSTFNWAIAGRTRSAMATTSALPAAPVGAGSTPLVSTARVGRSPSDLRRLPATTARPVDSTLAARAEAMATAHSWRRADGRLTPISDGWRHRRSSGGGG